MKGCVHAVHHRVPVPKLSAQRRHSTWMRSRRSSSGRGRHRTSALTCSCASTMLKQAGSSSAGYTSYRLLRALVECGQYLAAIGISYAGLEALGLPKDSLQSFPEAFRVGMAARARHSGTKASTIRRIGTRRSAPARFTSG